LSSAALAVLITRPACHPSLISYLPSLRESLPSVFDAYAVSGMPGAKTRVHTLALGESEAQNGLPGSIISSEPKTLVQHRPHPSQSVWSPNGLSNPPEASRPTASP
nr:hypothetical protein [Tanacetum cinerariifolium]